MVDAYAQEQAEKQARLDEFLAAFSVHAEDEASQEVILQEAREARKAVAARRNA